MKRAGLTLALCLLAGCALEINWAEVSASVTQVPEDITALRLCLVPEQTRAERPFEIDAAPEGDGRWRARLPRIDRGVYTVVVEGRDDAGRLIGGAVLEGRDMGAGSNDVALLLGPASAITERRLGGCPSTAIPDQRCAEDVRCDPADFADPQNLVINGNFEDPPIEDAKVATLPTGWRWDGPSTNTELIRCSHLPPAAGCQAVDLIGANARGLLSQTLATQPDQAYCVGVSYAASPASAMGWAEADVNLFGAAFSKVVTLFHTAGTPADLRFERAFFGFRAPGPDMNLRFIGTGAFAEDGMIIDDVRVTAGACPAIECLPAGATAPDELLENGGFEAPGQSTIIALTSPPGWSPVPGVDRFVELVGVQQWPPREGCHSLYLAEHRGAGQLQQTVATTPGASYCLRVWVTNWPIQPGGGAEGRVQVLGAGTLFDAEVRRDFASRDNMDYQRLEASFVADGAEATVRFVGGSLLPGGLVLDEASLRPGACGTQPP